MKKKVRLNKKQVEDIKKLVSEYGSTKEAVEAHAKMMMHGYEWTSLKNLNEINPQTLDLALRYGYDVGEWEFKELNVLDDEVKKELIEYIGGDFALSCYGHRKDCYNEIKVRREKEIPFTLYKSLNDVDLELLAKALGISHTETLDIFESVENLKSEVVDIRKNEEKKYEKEYNDEKTLGLEIDYELASLQIALEKVDEEEIERCKMNLKELTKKQKDAK